MEASQPVRKPAVNNNFVKRVVAGTVLVGLAVAAVFAIAMLPTPEEEIPPVELKPVNVTVWPVQPVAELADTFVLSAVVEPERVVNVAAEVSARIERYAEHGATVALEGKPSGGGMPLEEGASVSEGDPLVYLNSDLLQARYDRARAQLEYDERELNRLKRLFEQGNTSQTELDDARTSFEISKANTAEAWQELQRATISAPINGILDRLPMEPGEFATPGAVVAQIVNTAQVKVMVDIPERDIHYLSVGDPVEVLVEAPGLERVQGYIRYLGAVAEPQTRTTPAEILIDNADGQLRSGQIVRVRLTRRVIDQALMIPLASVIPLEVDRVVYVVNDQDEAARRTVELGFIRGQSIRVLNGLTPGDRLIVDGHRFVGPGQPVAVVNTLQQSPAHIP
jgi:membrane fusion protein (multidrug efflux system)